MPEQMEDSLELLRWRLGWPAVGDLPGAADGPTPGAGPFLNSGGRGAEQDKSSVVYEQLSELNQLDLELYQYGVQVR